MLQLETGGNGHHCQRGIAAGVAELGDGAAELGDGAAELGDGVAELGDGVFLLVSSGICQSQHGKP